MEAEYSQPPYNRKVDIPAEYNWQSLKLKRGAELEVHYVTLLMELGKKPGMLGGDFHQGAEQNPGPGQVVPFDRYGERNPVGDDG